VRPRLFYALTKSMAIASIAIAGCVVLLQLLAAVFVWPGNRAVEDKFVAGGDIMDVFTTYDAVSAMKFLLFPAAYIVTCMWLWGVRRNAEALNPIARHVRERGWVWGSWVCPVVSLWFPFQIVRDVQAATNPHGRRTALIGWWWAAFLVLNLTLNAYSLQGGNGYDVAEVKACGWCGGKRNFCHQPQARERQSSKARQVDLERDPDAIRTRRSREPRLNRSALRAIPEGSARRPRQSSDQ
jgi:hypothetical protein